MERLRRALLDLDRRMGGDRPPGKAVRFTARHPVMVGAVCGVLNALLCAWVISAFGDPVPMLQSALWGLGLGVFFWLLCRLERRRQAHYERSGGWRSAPPPAVAREPLPVWQEGVRWTGLWAVYTVGLWLLGRLRHPPDGWLWSAIEAGLVIIGAWAARRFRERGGRSG
ncbi:hypothetical protein [Streptomyces spinosirectus]